MHDYIVYETLYHNIEIGSGLRPGGGGGGGGKYGHVVKMCSNLENRLFYFSSSGR